MFYPVKVTDVSLRDGQEDFVHKYLRQEDLMRLVSLLDRAGFYSIDCWGGDTFYAALMELKEDPWGRLRRLRRALSHTPLQMILRGQMLVGFKPYHPEVVRKFITRAAHHGVDIFRIYDNLNDADNMAVAIDTAKELRKQVEATVLVSISPHVTVDDYLAMAGQLINLGADVICVNDSFGVMTPVQMANLVTAYRRYFHQPLRLHLHDNHQAAITCYREGVRQGAEMVDTTLAALSWPYGPPPLQSLIFTLGGTVNDPHIDMDILGELSEYVADLKDRYHYREPAVRKTEDRLGTAYIPGPLKDFVREELVRRDARDRQQVTVKEAHEVWGDLGYPVLKGRILEIVGLQAVENILSGQRYANLIPSMLDLLRGRFGRLHSPARGDLQERALAGGEGLEEQPMEMEGHLLSRPDLELEEDILTYTLFPEEAEAFFLRRTESAAAPARTPPPAVPGVSPFPSPISVPQLTVTYKGEEVYARLEGWGRVRKGKQVMFINIHDTLEEIEVQAVPGTEDSPEFLVTLHGETHRIRISKTFARDEEYTPVFLEINGQMEEFLIK